MRTPLYARDLLKNEDRYVQNVLDMFDLANAKDIQNGRRWYELANRFCRTLAERHGRKLADVAGIMALLSPAVSLEQNVIDTVEVMANGQTAKPSTYGPQAEKALAVRDAGIDPAAVLGQNKVAAFWANIVNPGEAGRVTIDRHAARIAADWKLPPEDAYYLVNTPGKYKVFERVYRRAAEKLGILPQQLQAITWTAYRRLFVAPRYRKGDGRIVAPIHL
jgi:hypothetical protein